MGNKATKHQQQEEEEEERKNKPNQLLSRAEREEINQNEGERRVQKMIELEKTQSFQFVHLFRITCARVEGNYYYPSAVREDALLVFGPPVSGDMGEKIAWAFRPESIDMPTLVCISRSHSFSSPFNLKEFLEKGEREGFVCCFPFGGKEKGEGYEIVGRDLELVSDGTRLSLRLRNGRELDEFDIPSDFW
eukprot:CAMPEP_0201477346 /NCGR_PEP_ID=MMETSP0151_2-20130828/2382_1 /ASSEMBLY_ACC=CAM_ASM_000257 /TAXON_ID=200890 /ORGANISM="Paramoeba atlantica, Strain 621/1 / CCAP 1560/9" /LENGTH=190 /DNA_ID=CAMNT_0047858027 /DNA_START=115 /DNA_END=684 /DNA_ORIENTATION=-